MSHTGSEGLRGLIAFGKLLTYKSDAELLLLVRDLASVNKFLDRYQQGRGKERLVAAIEANVGFGLELCQRLLESERPDEAIAEKDFRRFAVAVFLLREKTEDLLPGDRPSELIERLSALEAGFCRLLSMANKTHVPVLDAGKPCA